jgi:thiosulfate reductase cytochrome b subunit
MASKKQEESIINQMAIDQAVILNKLTNLESTVCTISKKLEDDYVTQDQFEPVKKIVYGLVSIILVAVVGGLIALVIRQ